MQKLFLALIMVVFMAGSATAHGNISKLPFSVQILQYKMKLYMNAEDLETINNLAMAYFYSGELANAKEQLELILEKDPHNFNALDGMGMIYLKEKDSYKALEYLLKAQKINGNDMYLLVHLAVAHGMEGQEGIAGKEMNLAKSLSTGEYDMTWIENEINILNDPQKTGAAE